MGFLFVISAELVGIVSSLSMGDSLSTWYAFLEKPVFSPPSWVFGPVWTILYALMGIAAYMVWRKRHGHNRSHLALRLYWAQLMFNFLWSIAFFGMRNPALALADIVLLLGALVVATVYFFKVRRAAGWLMVPYIAWVMFATALNAAIVVLN
ncbi:MAG TPA: TspO/MBR family protein [Candidatus Paceibacterota bacterium]|nr:TspO/MBR family protein [Candidatus Paceibacterota bacterium]